MMQRKEDAVVGAKEAERMLAGLQEQGATARFRCRPNGIMECMECGYENQARDTLLLALYRVDAPERRQADLEGAEPGRTDDDTPAQGVSVIAVIRCADCDREGSFVFAQGPASTRDESFCLGELCAGQ